MNFFIKKEQVENLITIKEKLYDLKNMLNMSEIKPASVSLVTEDYIDEVLEMKKDLENMSSISLESNHKNNGINSNTSFTQCDYGEEVFIRWDDLLFSWSGNPQTSIDVFRYRLRDGWLNQHIFKVTANEELVTKDFLYYVLKFLKPLNSRLYSYSLRFCHQ